MVTLILAPSSPPYPLARYLNVMLGPDWHIEFRQLSQEQYKKFRAEFDTFDTNKNGGK